MRLGDIAKALDCRLVGDPDIEITGVAGLEDAGPSDLTFLSNPRYASLASQTRAAALIVDRPLDGVSTAFVVSANPYLDFARSLELLLPPAEREPGRHPTAVIAETATVGPDASIGPFAVIEDDVVIGRNATLGPHAVIGRGARIGDDFVAHAGATVCHGSRIGNRVVLHQRVTIGSDGFGFARRPDGTHKKILQAGHVVIEDDVEVQAGSCIDRAAVGETRIGRGTIIDNLVQIGHAVKVGANTILCAQVGIAGSTTLGSDCILAGQAGIINHLSIGNRVLVTAQSGVGRDLGDDSKVSGSPAIDNRQWLRSTAAYTRLPEIDREVRRLRKRVEDLEEDS